MAVWGGLEGRVGLGTFIDNCSRRKSCILYLNIWAFDRL